MSCKRTVQTFEKVTIQIDECNKSTIVKAVDTIKKVIIQKLSKLNIIFKNCNLYVLGDVILINDRYNTCQYLKDVVEAFGLDIKEVKSALRGNTYIVSDKLLMLLKQLGGTFELDKCIKSLPLDDPIKKLLDKEISNRKINSSISEIVNNILKNGKFTFENERVVTTTSQDGHILSKDTGSWKIDVNDVNKTINNLTNTINNTVNSQNDYLRDGTTKLIYSRAKEMGYSVQQVKKGKQVQLVLVRY